MAEHEHEPAGFASRPILYAGAALLALMALISVALLAVIRKPHSAQRNAATTESPPQPSLQPRPSGDLAAYRAKKNALLTNYAWIDRNAGTVRIPIDRAMEIVAQRSLHSTPPDRR